MKEIEWSYVVTRVVFGYLMYPSNINLIIAIILGLGVALSGNTGCIFKRNKNLMTKLLLNKNSLCRIIK